MRFKFYSFITTLLLVFFISCTDDNQIAHQQIEPISKTILYDKPTNKDVVTLNSSAEGIWTLHYGLQNEHAPKTPKELKKSGLRPISATVPGNVEIDLMAEGLIEDPLVGNNVNDLRKYETYQWWYHRKFEQPVVPKGSRVELCFDGIDTFADIWLNGRKIGTVENMLVEHRFDITDYLEKENELYIRISSTILEARKHRLHELGERYNALAEAVSIRKPGHMFGWDILPRLISAGLWKDVKMEIIPSTYWESVYWATKWVWPKERKADLYVNWQFQTDRLDIDDLTMNIFLRRNGKTVYEHSEKVYTTVSRHRIYGLKDVDLWWPRGFGEPSLYEAVMELVDKDGKILASNVQNIGIRKVELISSDISTMENPGEFYFKVNGEKVFIKGTNWITLDAIHSRDKEHIKPSFDMLVDLNCNMIRLWGGNVYEHNEFYDLCDQNGIMVWQDFAFACNLYPQSEEFSNMVREEAKKVILRLRNHPSIVIWVGNNENDIALDFGGGDQIQIDPNTDVISRKVLPEMVRRYDPKTPYLPSSPYISPEAFKVHNSVHRYVTPEQHLWGKRGYYKAPFYTKTSARFLGEIGYHGCPSRESLEKMFDEEFVYPWQNSNNFEWNDQWKTKAVRAHPSSPGNDHRNDYLLTGIKSIFNEVPRDLDKFIIASQIVQAEAMKYFVEFWRMRKFDEGSGILWWRLRDGWPVISNGIVDYYYDKKLAYQYIKRVQTDVCVMIGDASDKSSHPIIVVNDTREAVKGILSVKNADNGKLLYSKNFTVNQNGKSIEGYLPESIKPELWLIEWEINGNTHTNHYFSFKPQVDLEVYLKWLPML